MIKLSHIVKYAAIFCALISTCSVFATHNRAGEITYTYLGGFRYRVTIVTYTKISAPADRDSLTINWGDGSNPQSLPRTELNDQLYGERDIRRNTYVGTHTYPGPGRFVLSFEDPNRNNNILNLKPPQGQSDQVTFYIESTIIINPFAPENVGQNNNSVLLLNPPIDIACFGQTFIHNPGAFDPDGDSLVYSLAPSRISGGVIPEFYVFPDEISPGANNSITIDPITGDMIWDAPQRIGEYNVAILIQEFREGILVGEVLRDMQIEVRGCNNKPPVINNNLRECVVAGDILSSTVTATDPDGDDVFLTAVGELFMLNPNAATFDQNSNNPASAELNWLTFCKDVRLNPYISSFKAEDDNAQTPLVDFGSQQVFVLGPPVQNLSISATANQINVNWSSYQCTNAIGFKVYRKQGSSGYIPAECETGVPATTGYVLYATIGDLTTTSFTDTEVADGLEYCYIITACYPDGSESIASAEICSLLDSDRPYFTKVSVGITNANSGIDTIEWRNPIDTIDLKNRFSNFSYTLSFIDTDGNKQALQNSGPSNNFSDLSNAFLAINTNTVDSKRDYSLDFFTDGNLFATATAASLHLTTNVNDRRVNLSWNTENAWSDTAYDIFKQNPGTSTFFLLNTVAGNSFSDQNLNNGEEYCYYIVEHAKYINPQAEQNIINYSQQICAIPEDNTAPCKPIITANANCETRIIEVNFTDSAFVCATDVEKYYLYFSSSMMGEFTRTDSVSVGSNSFSYTNDAKGISGCYYVTSVDFNGNESNRSNIFCSDSCDTYTLPNVFTPNGDGSNDFFRPFPFNGVQNAEVKIFNRWGKLVFETDDPNILWDGNYQNSGNEAGEGVFFYIIKFLQNTINGPELKELQGDFTLIRD